MTKLMMYVKHLNLYSGVSREFIKWTNWREKWSRKVMRKGVYRQLAWKTTFIITTGKLLTQPSKLSKKMKSKLETGVGHGRTRLSSPQPSPSIQEGESRGSADVCPAWGSLGYHSQCCTKPAMAVHTCNPRDGEPELKVILHSQWGLGHRWLQETSSQKYKQQHP